MNILNDFISKPEFPPMAGYIEIVNEDGTHSLVPTIEERDKQEQLGNIDTLTNEMDILLNVNGSNKNNNPLANAEQFRKVIQLFVNTFDEETALEVPSVYPEWEVNYNYKQGDIISYGQNSLGDPQLYKVVKEHTSQDDWKPGVGTESLYTAFGVDESGIPIWKQPSGAHDAYNKGDKVKYNEKYYESLIDGNVWAPETYSAGWKEIEI